MCLLFSKLSKYYHHPSSQWTVFEPFITVKRPGMFQLQAHSQFHTEISFLYLFFSPLETPALRSTPNSSHWFKSQDLEMLCQVRLD